MTDSVVASAFTCSAVIWRAPEEIRVSFGSRHSPSNGDLRGDPRPPLSRYCCGLFLGSSAWVELLSILCPWFPEILCACLCVSVSPCFSNQVEIEREFVRVEWCCHPRRFGMRCPLLVSFHFLPCHFTICLFRRLMR